MYHVCSHSPAGSFVLVRMAEARVRDGGMSARPSTPVLLPHSVGQRELRSQPRAKDWENRLHLSMEELELGIAEGSDGSLLFSRRSTNLMTPEAFCYHVLLGQPSSIPRGLFFKPDLLDCITSIFKKI